MSETEPVVYVVDDNPSIRRALQRLLKSVGLEAESFGSATQFLAHDLPARPSCLVLDVRMPRVSGLDLQKELARAGIDIPIIFITGHGDVPMAVQAMKDGAADFLAKPYNNQELLDAIHRALERHRKIQSDHAELAEIRQRVNRLTPRECQVMQLVVAGLLNKQIGAELGTTEKTIKVHRSRVMEKMQAESLAELVRLAGKVDIHGPDSLDSS